MDKREEIKGKIYAIEDKIRQAPEGTPQRQIYEWYAETDSLRDELDRLDRGGVEATPDESNVVRYSNADAEERATDQGRQELVEQWNEGSDDTPQSWSQIVGTAK